MTKILPGLDIFVIRENPEEVKRSLAERGLNPAAVDEVLELDKSYRGKLRELEILSQESNRVTKAIQTNDEQRGELIAKAKELGGFQKELEREIAELKEALGELTREIPNLVHPAVPNGGEKDFKVLRTFGEKPEFDFPVNSHYKLGEQLKLYDAPRGAKVSGARFVFLRGAGVILEKALLDYALHKALDAGFIPLATPTLVRKEIMEGTGFTTKHNDEIYQLPADELYLTGTSEVALAGYHSGEILELDEPLKYAGISTCYRREAGAAGKDTRGLIRLHQFTKLEAFIFATQSEAEKVHETLVELQETILQELGLHYRVIDTAAGDLGTSAYRKYDIEAWLPSQERYLELTSSSNCLTYQAKQLNTRYKTKKGNVTAATLNGTLATTRWLVAILEQFQQPDGSIKIPEVLHPFTHGITTLNP